VRRAIACGCQRDQDLTDLGYLIAAATDADRLAAALG
jgi:hypothetical protein